MNYKYKLLSDIINSQFTAVLGGKANFVHFHAINGNTLTYYIENAVNNLEGDFSFLRFQLSQSDIKGPYAPFMNLISQFVKTRSINISELLQKADVYPLHRPIFESYFNNTIFNRNDEIIFDELFYETEQIRESIAKLISELSRITPLIIAVADVQYGNNSDLLFIQSLKNLLVKGKVLFIFSYNKNYHFPDEDKNDNWDNFTDFAEEIYSIFDFDIADAVEPVEWPSDKVSVSVEDILHLGEMNLNFLCFDSAISCAARIIEIANDNTSPVCKNSYLSALQILGDCYYYMEENDTAVTYYCMLQEEAHKDNNIRLLSEAYRKTALAHINKYDIEKASKLAHQSLKYTNMLQDERQLIRVYMLLYLIGDKTTRPIERSIYFTLLDLLEKYNLENSYAFCLQNSYMYINYYGTVEEIHTNCDKAIELSKKLQNKFALAVCFHKKCITYSYTEDYERTLYYLMKSKNLLLQLGHPLHIVRVYNGIGYYYMCTNDYKRAHRYFAKSIGLFGRIQDYNEVSATLYNLSMLYYLGRDFKGCIKIVDKLLQIMKIFKMTYLPYRTIEDIYTLKAMCCFKLGEQFKSMELVNRLKSSASFNLSKEMRLMYSMLEGLIYASGMNYEKAVNSFEEALNESDLKNKSRNLLLPSYYLEYGQMLLSIGKTDSAAVILKTGIHLCSELNFEFHKRLMENALENRYDYKIQCVLPKTDINLEAIVEAAKQEVTLNKLHKKIREIEFINKIQEFSSSYTDKQHIAESYLELIHINFSAEAAFLYISENGKKSCIASKYITDANCENLLEYIDELNSANRPLLLDFIHNHINPEMDGKFSSIINIPVSTGNGRLVGLFLATVKPENFFTSNDLNILSISTKQIVTIFTKIDQDRALVEMSRTDILTGLHNRQALQIKLDDEMAKIINQGTNQKYDLSILFIDLDDFKYYNDTFGHNMGDIIIKYFGEMLKRKFTPPDFIARFGGDEFVAVLPGTGENAAKSEAERMIRNIFHCDNLKNLLSNAVGHTVDIPEGKALSCSVGIAGYKFTTHKKGNLNTLMHNADKALYKAKSLGKSTIVIY